MGNHDDFLIKALSEQLGYEDILKLLDSPEGFKTTNYYYCLVYVGEDLWRITHPRNISVIHSRIAQRLAIKYGCNVVSGHGHLAGITFDEGNRYWAIDGGVGCVPAKLDYASERDTTRPAMCQAAVFIMLGEDGISHPYLVTPKTDWKAMKRLYGKQKRL
jgi:hypothetical protein